MTLSAIGPPPTSSASPDGFDMDHYKKFKADLDKYLQGQEEEFGQRSGRVKTDLDKYLKEGDDPFFLSA